MSSTQSTSASFDTSRSRAFWTGFLLACGGSVLFSAKAVVAKLTYLYGVDALTVMGFRMMFSLPLFALVAFDQARRARIGQIARLNGRDIWQILLLGFIGYYLSPSVTIDGRSFFVNI